MLRRFGLAACALLALGTCASPEATRIRGGGPGADLGNSSAPVVMHEGADPYFGTEHLIEPYGQMDLEPARHAHRLSTS